MAITRTAMIDDDGSGTTGTIINNAWKQEFYNQIDALAGATWITIAHNPANFTANAGTWTVTAANQKTWRYAIVGNIAFFVLQLDGTTISAGPSRLTVTLPAGVQVPPVAISIPMVYYHAGGAGNGYVEFSAGLATVNLLRDMTGLAWVTTSNNLYLGAQWFYPTVA